MKKLLGATFAAVAIAFISSGTPGTAGKKPPAKTGTIEIIESKDGKFRFSIRDTDGKYLAGSAVGHATEKETREVVEELKKVLATATYVHKKTDTKKEKPTE